METPPQTQSFASLLKFDADSSNSAMSPVTNLAHNLSGLRTTIPRTPTRRISWSSPSPSPLATLIQNNSPSDSPISIDSPMFQEGIFKGIRDKKSRLFYSRKTADTPPTGDKENSIAINRPLLSSGQTKIDSVDDSSGGSQESGFVERHSYTSQSSVVSVRSSVFTDDELEDDDEDTMFAVDKFVEDDESSEMSSSMTQLINGPLSISSDQVFKFKMAASKFPNVKENGLPLRRCLSMSIQRINPSTPLSSQVSNEVEAENDGSTIDGDRLSKFAFKRPEPLDRGITPLQSKRRKSSPLVIVPPGSVSEIENQPPLVRCYSETAATIMKAVQKSLMQPDLIGDCSRPFALPLIKGRHADLKAIDGETLIKLLKGKFNDSVKDFLVVDCRYPYEYEGGHIIGAKNIYTKESIYNTLLPGSELSLEMEQGSIIVFHCEFSSERAPKLLRFLRNKDRELNEEAYPRLYHPEMYVLEGGYKAFYNQFIEFCEPQEYTPMLHKDHTEELREYQKEGKSKAWGKLRENRSFKTRKFKPSC